MHERRLQLSSSFASYWNDGRLVTLWIWIFLTFCPSSPPTLPRSLHNCTVCSSTSVITAIEILISKFEALLRVSELKTTGAYTLFPLQSITLKFNSIKKKKHSLTIGDKAFFFFFSFFVSNMSCLEQGGFIRCLEVYEASLFISCYLVFKFNLYDTWKTAVKFTAWW